MKRSLLWIVVSACGIAGVVAKDALTQPAEARFSMYEFVLGMTDAPSSPLKQCAAEAMARMVDERIGVGTLAWRQAKQALELHEPNPAPERIATNVLQAHQGLLLDDTVARALVAKCAGRSANVIL